MTIIHKVAASVGDGSWDRGVCWRKLRIVLASGNPGDINLMEIVGSLTSIGDIWSGIVSGGTDHGTGVGAEAAGINN